MALVRGGITVKPHVQRCADDVVAEFGAGLAPGTYNGHSPPEGPTQALDLFNVESQAGWQLQNRVADWLIKNQKKYGVRYVIKWNPNGADWIWNVERAGEGWRAMATRDHRNHVHVTFYSTAEKVVEKPIPIKGDAMSLSVRFIHDPVNDPIGRVDWVFDGPSRIFAPVGVKGVLEAVDACDFPELGEVDAQTYQWFKDAASMWGQDRD